MTPATPRPTPFLIDDPRQVRALRSPARQEVIDAVQAAGPLSISDLGTLLGRAPDSLYYHVRALLKLGLLVEARPTPDPGRGLLIDVPGRPMQIRYRVEQPAHARALTETVASMLRLTSRDFTSAVSLPSVVAVGPDRNLWAARAKARLTPSQVRRLSALLREATDILVAGNRNAAPASSDDSTLVALTFVLTPIAPRRVGATGTTAPKGESSARNANRGRTRASRPSNPRTRARRPRPAQGGTP